MNREQERSNKAEVPVQILNYFTFEQRLHKVLTPLPAEVLTAYEYYRDDLEEIYGRDRVKNTLLFHGTGYLHYSGDKYKAESKETTVAVLENVFESGLLPSPDPWVVSPANQPILEMYHKIDAGSYTTDGGTIGSLNYVFTIDHDNETLTYAPAIQQMIDELKAQFGEKEDAD